MFELQRVREQKLLEKKVTYLIPLYLLKKCQRYVDDFGSKYKMHGDLTSSVGRNNLCD